MREFLSKLLSTVLIAVVAFGLGACASSSEYSPESEFLAPVSSSLGFGFEGGEGSEDSITPKIFKQEPGEVVSFADEGLTPDSGLLPPSEFKAINDQPLPDPVVNPEPASAGLLGLSGLALLARRRRRTNG